MTLQWKYRAIAVSVRPMALLQRYQIASILGKGAFGTTYKARDLDRDRWVAVKVLSLKQVADWKIIEMFEREAQVLERLNHPGIPNYVDYFYRDTQDDRLFCLVQELVEGKSLAAWVKQGWRATEEDAKQIAVKVLEILDYLHWQTPPVIHRDIKPQNIILKPDRSVYLVDFGAVQDLYRNSLILGGTFVGTVGYMPPEQFRGKAFLASDVYALGATLLFLLSHRSPEELPRHRLKIDVQKAIQVSDDFARWLEKMVEPAIEDRYKSAREALDVLQGKRKLLRSPPPSDPILPQRRQPKGSRIQVWQNDDRATVNVPAAGVAPSNLPLLGVTVVWNFVIGSTVAIAFFGGNWLILPFVSLHALAGLGLLFTSLGITASYGRLTIDRHRFSIYRRCFGVTYHQYQGKTSELQGVGLEVSLEEYGQRKVRCVLQGSDRTYDFAPNLTPVEKRWLVEVISNLLEKFQSDSDDAGHRQT
ncbi:serine/threonine protein kinase [Baaleninema sp.]|uniref:serine/threonine protein kinase n=1 Tax=Baaleninema sp. TaxID=3101197 RepID=UPI003D0192E2